MKKILFTLAAVSLASFSFAQDFGFGDEMSGGDFGSYEEESSPAVTISGEVGAETRAWIGTKRDIKQSDGSTENKYDTHGYAYGGPYELSKTELDANAYANLELNYDGDYTNANIKLKLDPSTLTEYHEDIIDEVSASGSFKDGKFQLKAGKMKEVWGKGDKIHVLDNFNANDYTDFVFPDYIDRRIGEVMFKATANLSWDYNLKLEGIFTPWMTADRFADEDSMLYPYAQARLTGIVQGIKKAQAKETFESEDSSSIVNGLFDLTSFSSDDLYPDDLHTLKYSQAGARLTGTLGGIDWGASYYYGHYKQPSANLERYAIWSNSETIKAGAWQKYEATAAGAIRAALAQNPSVDTSALSNTELIAKAKAGDYGDAIQTKASSILDETTVKTAVGTELSNNGYTLDNALPSLNYDQLQVFGLEAAFVLWKLNTRWEFAYNLTEDIAGDNPWVKNNSIGWVAGFDIDLPIHNLNLNVQTQGSYVLKNDKIEDGKVVVGSLAGNPIEVPIGTADVDYKSDGKYCTNKLIVLLSDKWLNEKLTTEVQGIWGIEHKEFMVAPKIEYNITEGLTLAARGVYLYSNNEDGEFYNFTADSEHHDKAFLQLSAKYQF